MRRTTGATTSTAGKASAQDGSQAESQKKRNAPSTPRAIAVA
ncbi:MAG: hypothetical protein RIF44_19030 [Nitratireductor sp.]